jgi:hypothetical protein
MKATPLEQAIAESKSREEKATKGPWISSKGGCIKGGEFIEYARGKGQSQLALTIGAENIGPEERDSNSEFISAARTWEPKWREMVEYLLKSVEIAREKIRRLYPTMKEDEFNRAFEKIMGLNELNRIAKEGLEK